MRSKALILAIAVLLVAGISVLSVSSSSHREAPLISQDPAVDGTDTYAFVDPNDPTKVNLIANFYPAQAAYGGPNFYKFATDALYKIHIDNDGDALEDITYKFVFSDRTQNPNTFLYNTGPITSLTDPDWNLRQVYDVRRVAGTASARGTTLGESLSIPPVNIGPKSTPNYDSLAASAVHDLSNGVKVFAGQRDDPFYVDLGSVFDLLTIRQLPGNAGGGIDGLTGLNVHTIAIQVPIDQISAGDPVIGVWSTASRPSVKVIREGGEQWVAGQPRQVSRLGMPLVNEVVIPLGKKDRFNASHPIRDGQFLEHVTDPELAVLFNALYGDILAPVPETNRSDLVAVFLTGVPTLNQPVNGVPSEMLRLNTSIAPNASPDRLGALAGDFAGFPNGRRLTDDVVDIALRAAACGYGDILEGALGLCNLSPNNLLGDGVDENDVALLNAFPYVATPHSGFDYGTGFSISRSTLSMGIGASFIMVGIALGAVYALRRRHTRSIS